MRRSPKEKFTFEMPTGIFGLLCHIQGVNPHRANVSLVIRTACLAVAQVAIANGQDTSDDVRSEAAEAFMSIFGE